eukprot:Skav206975  [mRNA]  locus=scaffold1394:18149:18436:+ [translate_table: standard]
MGRHLNIPQDRFPANVSTLTDCINRFLRHIFDGHYPCAKAIALKVQASWRWLNPLHLQVPVPSFMLSVQCRLCQLWRIFPNAWSPCHWVYRYQKD